MHARVAGSASTKVTNCDTNKEVLVIEELDGGHSDNVDFETTPFVLVAKGNFKEQTHSDARHTQPCIRTGNQMK